MNRMLATMGLFAVLLVINGCGSDNSAELMESKDKLTKELDAVKSQLSAVVATEAATATKLDALTILANNNHEQIRAIGHDSQQSRLELDALKLKLSSYESKLATGKQAKRASGDHSSGAEAADMDDATGSTPDK